MAEPAPVRLFSYGSLRMEAVQLANFGRRLTGSADALPGYRQSEIVVDDPKTVALSGTNVHSIVTPSADPADEVPGVVFEITEAELIAADAYEPPGYGRVLVRLRSGVDAWVYVQV